DSVIFSDSFEAGLASWIVDGSDGVGGPPLWHLSSHRAGSPSHALYYGREATLTYNTGARNFGSIVSPPIDLPGLTAATLSFSHLLRSEGLSPFDQASVSVTTDEGLSFSVVYATSFPTPGDGLQPVTVDLSAFAGSRIRLKFSFDTLDSLYNDFEGWVLDDVSVSASSEPDPSAPRKLWLTVGGLDAARGSFFVDPPGA